MQTRHSVFRCQRCMPDCVLAHFKLQSPYVFLQQNFRSAGYYRKMRGSADEMEKRKEL